MTGSPFAYRQSYPLRDGYSVSFNLDGLRLTAEWSPDVPRGKQARKLLRHYRSARGRFIASLGIPAMVIEA